MQHLQKRLVGLDYLTLDVRDEDSQNAGFDQAPDLIFGGLAFGDVGHSPDKLAVAGCILYRVSYRMDVLDSPVRQQQAILMFEVSASLGCAIDDLLCKRPILGMYALHHRIDCWL